LSIGIYLLGLTDEGTFDVGLISGIKLEYNDSDLKANFKRFEGMVIKNFFVSVEHSLRPQWGFLMIMTEEELLIFQYYYFFERISFVLQKTFDLNALSTDISEVRNVIYLNWITFS
jgi:hypothetical protein